MIPRLVITPGEPAGIGPDIVIQIAQRDWPAELIVIADPALLTVRAKEMGLPLTLAEARLTDQPAPHQRGVLKILPVTLTAPVQAGTLNVANATYVLETLQKAAALCQSKQADAIVTGPVNKSILNEAGIAFTGHTEFFAAQSHVPHTVMLFVADQLRVALATTHLPLAAVAKAITAPHLRAVLTTLHHGLKKLFGISSPRLVVCGLNPHAGENGHLGREEIDTIIPLLNNMRREGFALTGPLPADTAFTPKPLAQADAILAMYHDQALPLVKYASFGHAVNVTLGLPYLRTSVDHGTALDIAGTGKADSGSLNAAISLAIKLASTPPSSND